ncbi:MAG: hypothetical protein ACLFRT_01890 [Actinomycetota bacterium]
MRIRWIALSALIAMVGVACNGDDAELTTDSTVITGATDQPSDATTTTTAGSDDDGDSASPSTTLVGEAVSEHEVVHEIPNEDGVAQHIVIPDGAYTDVDLQNFVFDLLEADPDLYGIEIFRDEAAAEAFLKPEDERTEEETELLEQHHFVTVTGRARIDFRGPFSEFPGGAIGS